MLQDPPTLPALNLATEILRAVCTHRAEHTEGHGEHVSRLSTCSKWRHAANLLAILGWQPHAAPPCCGCLNCHWSVGGMHHQHDLCRPAAARPAALYGNTNLCLLPTSVPMQCPPTCFVQEALYSPWIH